MLPFSTDRFMTWQPNIHSSLFMNLYQSLNRSSSWNRSSGDSRHRMYREYAARLKMPEVLPITRAA